MKSLFLSLGLLFTTPGMAGGADQPDEGGEYDVESPAEIEAARRRIEDLDFTPEAPERSFTAPDRAAVLARYAHLDPGHEISDNLLARALMFFDVNKSRFPNADVITIVDFTPRSDKFRLFVVDLQTGRVSKYHTTHGLNSDRRPRDGVAERFGNTVNSGLSSLGPVRTAEIYQGKFRRSLRLDGLAPENSNLRRRAVVMHGWDKVFERNVIQGLSWGCITLDWRVRDEVLDRVKGGSLIYVGQTRIPPVSKKRR